jgi:hypothetical protein
MTALWSLIPNWLKLVLAALVAAFLLGCGSYLYGKHKGQQEAKIEHLQADLKSERERATDDAKLRDLSDYDFCRLALERRGLPVDQCDGLRGLSQE